jgi:hypothetical protein
MTQHTTSIHEIRKVFKEKMEKKSNTWTVKTEVISTVIEATGTISR